MDIKDKLEKLGMIKTKHEASLGYLCSDIDNEGIIIYENNLAPKTYIYEYIDNQNDVYDKNKGLNTIECGGYNPMDNSEVRSKLLFSNYQKRQKRDNIIKNLFITIAKYPALLNRLYNEYYKNQMVCKHHLIHHDNLLQSQVQHSQVLNFHQ